MLYRWSRSMGWLPLLLLTPLSMASAANIKTTSSNSSTCAPVFGKGFWSSRDPVVKLTLTTEGEQKAPIGYLIYRYEDERELGRIHGDGTLSYFCTEEILGSEGCSKETLGQLLVKREGLEAVGKWSEAEGRFEGEYRVPSTGYYCVRVVNPTRSQIKIQAAFQNPYGELPAEYRPLMLLAGWLALIYLAGLALWSVLLVRYSRVVVSFQRYVAGVLALSLLEMLCYWAFYSSYNRSGSPSSFLLTLAAIVGASRMTAALFILLVVSMGYGTVLESLEDKAKKIYGLTGLYLAASIVNIMASLTTRTSGQLLLLLSTIGVVCGGAAFFTWTFDSLKTTIAVLLQRKQYAKLEMYYKLTSLLKALYTLTILLMIMSIVFIAGSSSSQAWYAQYWSWLWLMTDGWQSLLNLAACLGAAYIFRPRRNNRTHAMNQLASDPADFEGEDLESGGTNVVDMKMYKLYESKVREGSPGAPSNGYVQVDDPDWATPEDPFDSR